MRIDLDRGIVEVSDERGTTTLEIGSPEAFALISKAWIRSGWDAKYVYSFSWLGRPIIQLPEDMMRIQEVIYSVKPDVVLETGVAHGGSLIFYASIFKSMGKGRVIGIDIEIRDPNRQAIEGHELADSITLLEGSSTDERVVAAARDLIGENETVLILLDSDHAKAHVLDELNAYASMVTPGSYIVACDGVMQELNNAPRTQKDWSWNNPQEAVRQFLAEHPEFVLEEPAFPFNEGVITERVTYWPNSFLKRVRR